MSRPASPLLTRLRHHRGLWLLAVAVLMIKLFAGTICLGDAPNLQVASATAATTLSVASPEMVGDAVTASSCLLGEQGDCHCTCAHSVTLPATTLLPIATMEARFTSSVIHSGFTPATTGSLLRPPIA